MSLKAAQKLKWALEAKKYYERNRKRVGLCESFANTYSKIGGDVISQSVLIWVLPELREFRPKIDPQGFWWNFFPLGIEKRTEALNKLIKIYRDEKSKERSEDSLGN